MINTVADKTANRIATILQEGSNELVPVKEENARMAGESKIAIERQKELAEKAMIAAKKKIAETEESLKKMKANIKENQLSEYLFLRDKISKVVGGDVKWAEDVLKEAMI